MLPLHRACQTVGYACKEKIYLASLGKHRNSLQSRLRSRISFFFKCNHMELLVLFYFLYSYRNRRYIKMGFYAIHPLPLFLGVHDCI